MTVQPSRPPEALQQLKIDDEVAVWLIRGPDDRPRVLKQWRLTPITLIKLLLGISKPQRQKRGTAAVAATGVPTPAIITGPRLTRNRGLVVALELEFAAGKEALELLRRGELTPPDQVVLARDCGRVVQKLHQGGVFNRDLKLSNLVVDESRRFVQVIDTVGVRRSRRAGLEVGRMLERLDVEIRSLPVHLEPAARTAALRAALRPLIRSRRREALRWLREHRRR